jgi:ribosomal protein L20
MKKNNITVNRKILSEIAVNDPVAFTAVVKAAK